MRSDPSTPPDPAVAEAYLEFLRRTEVQSDLAFEDFLAERPAAERADLERLHAEFERVSALLERLTPLASLSDHLRARYGDSIDPGISLSGDDGAPSGSGESSGDTIARLDEHRRAADTRYDRRREIARGGMGKILEVWDGDLRRRLAMKVILGRRKPGATESEVDERRLSRFLEEAQITSQLDHPGIVPVHELGIDAEGRVYFTMQLVEGRDLRRIFELARAEREGWTRTRVISVLIRVCEAMAYAHSKGVVHRDLKPGNIMVGRFGETYVMDWGLAKVLGRPEPVARADHDDRDEASRVRTDRSDSASGTDDGDGLRTIDGDIVGTPAYMSPEQARGRMDLICAQSDVYSLGAMMYELLAGQMPYEPLGDKAPAHVILEAVRNGRPWALAQFDPDLPSELVAICEKAMARDIEDRYADTMDLAEDLRAYIENRTVAAYETGVLYEARKWVERNKPLAASLLAVIVIGLGSIGVFIRQQQLSLERLEDERNLTAIEAQRAEDAARVARASQEEAVVERDRADEAREEAVASAAAARRSSYRALINSASYSLRLNETMQAKHSLEACEPDLRAWEWHHLSLSVDEDLEQLARLDAGIALSYASYDSSRLLCVTSDFAAVVIETETGETRPLDRLGSFITMPTAVSAAIDETGRLVATCSGGNYVRVLDIDRDETLPSPDLPSTALVTGLRFLIDGRRLLVTDSEEGQARVRVHDLFDGRQIASYERHVRTPRCAEPRPRSSEVASGDDGGEVHVWDSEDGEQRLRLRGQHVGPIRALVWSQDGSQLASAGEDGTIAIWDAATGNLRTLMRGHEGPVTALVFGLGGTRVYSGGHDATLRVWDAQSGAELESLSGHEAAISGLSLAQRGEGLYSTSQDGSVRRWDPAWRPGRLDVPLRGWDQDWRSAPSGSLTDLDFSTDGRRVSGIRDQGGAATYDALAGQPLAVYDDRHFAGGEDTRVFGGGFFSERHALAACRLEDGRVRVIRTTDGSVVHDLPADARPATSVRLSPDGSRIAVGTRGGVLLVFDARSGDRLLRVEAHDRELAHLAFRPDGAAIATATRRELALWELETGDRIAVWDDVHAVGVNAIAYAPDGERIATASTDRTVRFWTVGNAEHVGELEGHEAAVMDVTFAGEGSERVITASLDGTVRMWDASSYEILTAMRVPGEQFGAVAMDPGKRRVAACGDRGVLYVWDSTQAVTRHRLWSVARREASDADLLLDEMEMRLRWSDAILAELEHGDGIPESMRRAAVERFQLRDRDVQMLQRRLRTILCGGALGPEDARRALELSERVQDLSRGGPDSGKVASRRLHGAALVRAGRALEGMNQLGVTGVSEFTRRFLIPRTESDVMLAYFRGLAQHELGRDDRAREWLLSADQSYELLPLHAQNRLAVLRRELRDLLGA